MVLCDYTENGDLQSTVCTGVTWEQHLYQPHWWLQSACFGIKLMDAKKRVPRVTWTVRTSD